MNATLRAGLAVLLLLDAGRAHAEAADDVASEATGAAPAEADPSWTATGSLYAYFVPESSDFVQPTVSADHRLLHLEARYSYEDLLTGSAWVGLNLSRGDAVWWELTPMAAAVFGRTNGVAPGYKAALGWWKLELYSEGEYVFDFAASADNFFFNWSEFTLGPTDWFRFGVMAQRTRTYSTGRVLDRGLLAGFTWEPVTLTLHLVDPDDALPIVIVALSATFSR
jgi:hypothetical protein